MTMKRLLVIVPATALGVFGYVLAVRRYVRHWGTTADELGRKMPGDELVTEPRWSMTLATGIDAPPEAVWPWLVQIGYQRGGLYSYDRLDRWAGILDRPSADRILPEFQHLQAGDVIPLGAGPDWPVAAVDPGRALVLLPAAEGIDISWAFALYPAGDRATRLVTRVRADFPLTPATALMYPFIDPTSFLMTRKMLLGIKERAERLVAAERAAGTPITPRVAA